MMVRRCAGRGFDKASESFDEQGVFRCRSGLGVGWVLASLVPNLYEFGLFIEFLLWGVYVSCVIWVLYTALEPYVRRRWPATLVSWSRCWREAFGIHRWDAMCLPVVS